MGSCCGEVGKGEGVTQPRVREGEEKKRKVVREKARIRCCAQDFDSEGFATQEERNWNNFALRF